MKNNVFIHKSSYVDENVYIGKNTKIWHFSHIQKNAKIGRNCTIGQNVNIGHNVIIGDNVKIQNNVSVYNGIFIEDSVFIGPSVVFTNVINPRSFVEKKDEFKQTLIKYGSTIGANATVICGHIIGKYSLIGAGSVVTNSVPDYALVYGNPARIKGWVCNCGEKLLPKNWIEYNFRGIMKCSKCDELYTIHENIVNNI